MTLRNVDLGTYTESGAVYYTDNCPFAGMYGVNGVCTPCPTGGVCPGGDRLRAQAVCIPPSTCVRVGSAKERQLI